MDVIPYTSNLDYIKEWEKRLREERFKPENMTEEEKLDYAISEIKFWQDANDLISFL